MTDSVKSAAEANSYAGGWELVRRATPLTFALTKLDIRAAFESGAAWQREQDESDAMKVAAQRAARIRELEADLDMARQEYHELEEFHRLYTHPYKQRAEQDEARLDKIRALAGDPGLWSAYDWRRTKLLELLDGEDDE